MLQSLCWIMNIYVLLCNLTFILIKLIEKAHHEALTLYVTWQELNFIPVCENQNHFWVATLSLIEREKLIFGIECSKNYCENGFCNRGFARRGTHLFAHDFVPLLGFLFVWRGIEKTTKHAITFDLLYSKIWNFKRVCVLIFLSLGRNLILWYELNKE